MPDEPPAGLGAPDPAHCTCAALGVTDLDRLQDLILAGFGQVEASLMLWHWSRGQVTRRLRRVGVTRKPGVPPRTL